MSAADHEAHVRGESLFVVDLPEPEGLLHAAVLASSAAHGRILHLDAGVETAPLSAVFDAREAWRLGHLIEAPRTLVLGDVAAAWRQCAVVAEGRAESGGQGHFYLETQAAMASPPPARAGRPSWCFGATRTC